MDALRKLTMFFVLPVKFEVPIATRDPVYSIPIGQSS